MVEYTYDYAANLGVGDYVGRVRNNEPNTGSSQKDDVEC